MSDTKEEKLPSSFAELLAGDDEAKLYESMSERELISLEEAFLVDPPKYGGKEA